MFKNQLAFIRQKLYCLKVLCIVWTLCS